MTDPFIIADRPPEHPGVLAIRFNVRDVPTALDLIGDIGNAGLVLDVWHFTRAGVPFSQMDATAPDRILDIQLNDGDSTSTLPPATDTWPASFAAKAISTSRSSCGRLPRGVTRALVGRGYFSRSRRSRSSGSRHANLSTDAQCYWR
ncbi:hypothetical protein QBK99_22520 [Corticibacterium sp. UT-5YL-CI-8]|nr:hypothetical protein [Tianweitania sp. UT-5YL-CI-8]